MQGLGNFSISDRNFTRRIDWSLVLYILALNIVGLINLFSATHGVSGNYNRLFYGQLVWIAMGWAIFFALTFVNYDLIRRVALPMYIINLFFLALVPLIGKSYYGAKRWLDLGISSYQPSETMKLALIFFLTRYLTSRAKGEELGLIDLFVPSLIVGLPFLLIAKQPDLGTALLIGFIGVAVLLFVGVKRYLIFIGLILGVAASYLAWNFALKEYQKSRIETFLDPGKDPRGSGYNSIQSKIAVGSGRILGKGFRKGTQSQLEFLPERHTDFIFSVLSEEHGFVGAVTTIGLYSILFLMGIRIASQAKDRFGVLLVIGCMSYLFGHMLINIGMVIGLLPIVGIPLPLLSYGGSSLFTTMVCLGITSSVSYRKYLF